MSRPSQNGEFALIARITGSHGASRSMTRTPSSSESIADVHVHPAGAAGAGDRAEHARPCPGSGRCGSPPARSRPSAPPRRRPRPGRRRAPPRPPYGVPRRPASSASWRSSVGSVRVSIWWRKSSWSSSSVATVARADVVTPGPVLAEPLDDLVRARRDLTGGRVEEQQLLLDPEGADGHRVPPARSCARHGRPWVGRGGATGGGGQLSWWGSTSDLASVDPPAPSGAPLEPAPPDSGSSRTMIDFDVGQLLPTAVESSGTSGLVSG